MLAGLARCSAPAPRPLMHLSPAYLLPTSCLSIACMRSPSRARIAAGFAPLSHVQMHQNRRLGNHRMRLAGRWSAHQAPGAGRRTRHPTSGASDTGRWSAHQAPGAGRRTRHPTSGASDTGRWSAHQAPGAGRRTRHPTSGASDTGRWSAHQAPGACAPPKVDAHQANREYRVNTG
jgi:hypothetical protein